MSRLRSTDTRKKSQKMLKEKTLESKCKPYLTSFAVFRSAIKRNGKNLSVISKEDYHTGNVDDTIDVSGIFTRECFQKWLLTRRGKIQHPEHSFQRALYAHIRGADGRKPFSEIIETELLKILRGWSNQKKDNPWNAVFDANKLNVGMKGFQSLGYHEKKRIIKLKGVEGIKTRKRRKLSSTSTPPTKPCKKSKKSEKEIHPIEIVQQDISQLLPSESSSSRDSPISFQNTTSLLNQILNIPSSSSSSDNSANAMVERPVYSAWEAFREASRQYIKRDTYKLFLHAALERKVPLTSPSLLFLLNQPPSPFDIRYQWDFLMPPPSERIFRENLPVGVLLHSKAWVCIGESEVAVKLLKRSSIGLHVFQINSSIANSLYCNIRFIPEFYGQGLSWCRLIMSKGDGTNGVFLAKCVMRENGQCVLHFQEQSDIFPDIVRMPFFI